MFHAGLKQNKKIQQHNFALFSLGINGKNLIFAGICWLDFMLPFFPLIFSIFS